MVRVSELEEPGALDVRVSTANPVHAPGRKLKFLVDVTNRTSSTLDLADLSVELRVLGRLGPEGHALDGHELRASDPDRPARVLLRQDWVYRWGREMLLAPGKRLTVPVVPEAGLELPVGSLPEGAYEVVAVINDRHESAPCRLQVLRPDLRPPLRRV